MRNADAAQHHRVARTEGMHVVAGGNAHRAGAAPRSSRNSSSALAHVLRRGELAIGFRAFDQRDVEAEPFGDAGIVGELARASFAAARWAARIASKRKPCGVCARHSPSRSTVPVTRPSLARFSVSVTGRQGRAPSCAVEAGDHAVDESAHRRRAAPRRGSAPRTAQPGERFEPGTHRVLPTRAARKLASRSRAA